MRFKKKLFIQFLVIFVFALGFLFTSLVVKKALANCSYGCCGSQVKVCVNWKEICDEEVCDTICIRWDWECTYCCPEPKPPPTHPTPTPGENGEPPNGNVDISCSGDCGAGGDSCVDGCVCCDWVDDVPNSGTCSSPTACICFTGETEIATKKLKNGETEKQKIEEIKVEDEVLCFDKGGQEKTCRVEEIFKRESDHYYLLETTTGRKVRVTAEHPFLALPQNFRYQDETINKSIGALFIRIKDLKVGDLVFIRDSQGELVPEEIVKLKRRDEPTEVYNLSVGGARTFFADGFAVHNKRGTGAPDCKITISQQIAVDETDYNPSNPNHVDSGLAAKLTRDFTAKELFNSGKIPFEITNEFGESGPVCMFGFSNWYSDYEDERSCGQSPLRDPPFSLGTTTSQVIGGACRGTGVMNDWYLHPDSLSWRWGCNIYGDDKYRNTNSGNFIIFTSGEGLRIVHINPPVDNRLVYKISFDYQALDNKWHTLKVSRHWKPKGNKLFYYAVPGGTLTTKTSGSKTVYLTPASDSVHLVSEGGGGDLLVRNIKLQFIKTSSATGTEDNKATVVNNSIGYAGANSPSQGVGGVWLSNDDEHWTYVAGGNWDQRDEDTMHGFEWDLGADLSEGERTVTVWALSSGILYSEGETSKCSDTVSFTPYTPPTGTITGNVYQSQFDICTEGGELEGWSVTCNDLLAHKTGPTQYECCADWEEGTCNNQLPYEPGGTIYNIKVTAPADYQKTSCSNGWVESGSDYIASVDLNDSSGPAPDLYLWQGAEDWFQTKEGDVHAEGTISSPIYPEDTYFCAADAGDYPGLVSYNDSEPDFGRQGTTPSEKGWLAEDDFSITHRFDYFYSKLGSPTEVFDCDTNTSPDDGIYLANNPPDGECGINKNLDFGTKKVVIFVDGDLKIDKPAEIKVGSGGFLAFIVKGDINIDGNIGNKSTFFAPEVPFDGFNAHLQGVYIADGVINTYYNKGVGDGSGFRLVAAGIFVANDFYLKRDLKDDCSEGICNETTPSELFIARPDLFVNIPDELKTSYFFEQEVAP